MKLPSLFQKSKGEGFETRGLGPEMEASTRKQRRIAHRQMRSLAAAQSGRLTYDWNGTNDGANALIRQGMERIRARSRELSYNNDYMKRFLQLCETNIVGHNGITLQAKITDPLTGKSDSDANARVEEQFEKWGRVGICTVDGESSWIDVQKMVAKGTPRDGEILVRKIFGKDAGNRFNFALQILEADHLPHDYNVDLPNGNTIRLGIERNKWGRVVAYHIYPEHPGQDLTTWRRNQKLLRIPAREMKLLYIKDRPSQARGIVWAVSAMMRLKMLGGYEEAELIGARIGASKMGFFISPDGAGYSAEDGDADEGEDLITEAEPGIFEQLPEGMKFESFNPEHPSGAFDPFTKNMKQGASAGMGVSYNALANDLTGVNFSSLRQGALWERDMWRMLHTWQIQHLCQWIYEDWLLMAITSEKLDLPVAEFARISKSSWKPRGWMWVDPVKEVNAHILAMKNTLRSAQSIVAESGEDYEEVVMQLKEEQELRKQYGLGGLDTNSNTGEPNGAEPEDDNEDE